MIRLLLLRAWLDTSSLGGWGYYSPLEGSCPTLIPVPEPRANLQGLPPFMDPFRWRSRCTGLPLAHYMPVGGEWPMHNDPRLDLGFYTDRFAPHGRLPRSLEPGDVIGFVAGLAVYPQGFWERRRRRSEILRAFRESVSRRRVGLYLIALLEVEKLVDTLTVGWENALKMIPALRESPHYHVGDPAVAVVGRFVMPREPVPLAYPSSGRLCGSAAEPLLDLLGMEAALSFLRQGCRKSRMVDVDPSTIKCVVGGC